MFDAGRVAARIITVVAAILAVTLAVFIGREIIQSSHRVGMWMILRASLLAALLILMAMMMISYSLRKFRAKHHE